MLLHYKVNNLISKLLHASFQPEALLFFPFQEQLTYQKQVFLTENHKLSHIIIMEAINYFYAFLFKRSLMQVILTKSSFQLLHHLKDDYKN